MEQQRIDRFSSVIPAKAGIHLVFGWVPAYAGTTICSLAILSGDNKGAQPS